MTEARLPLAELLEKAGEGDFLRAVAESVLQLLMEADVEGLTGAGRHERTAERLNYRNGSRERALDTRLGTLQLRIPELRQGAYFPPFLEPRKVGEKALVAVIQGRSRRSDRRDRRGLDPAGGRAGAGRGARGHLEEHGLRAVRGHRRAGGGRLPRPDPGGRAAVPVAGRHLPEGARGRADRLRRGHNRGRGRHRGAARDRGLGPRAVRGGDVLGHLPPRPGQAWAGRYPPRDLGRRRGPQGGDRQGAGGDLAAPPRAPDAERARPRAQGPADRGRRRRPPAGVLPSRPGHGPAGLAAAGRPAPPAPAGPGSPR
jgi:Transposase, Mutator family